MVQLESLTPETNDETECSDELKHKLSNDQRDNDQKTVNEYVDSVTKTIQEIKDENNDLYNESLKRAKLINNDKYKKIHEQKLNIINNSQNLLKSNNNLLNISREINLNDHKYNFRNKIANILGVVIGIGLIITLIIISSYLISNSNKTILKMKTIFG